MGVSRTGPLTRIAYLRSDISTLFAEQRDTGIRICVLNHRRQAHPPAPRSEVSGQCLTEEWLTGESILAALQAAILYLELPRHRSQSLPKLWAKFSWPIRPSRIVLVGKHRQG
jgi:hypothetical protein